MVRGTAGRFRRRSTSRRLPKIPWQHRRRSCRAISTGTAVSTLPTTYPGALRLAPPPILLPTVLATASSMWPTTSFGANTLSLLHFRQAHRRDKFRSRKLSGWLYVLCALCGNSDSNERRRSHDASKFDDFIANRDAQLLFHLGACPIRRRSC